MKHTISQLIRYAEDNNGMVFIDERYQTIHMLKDLAKKLGEWYKFELIKANSIVSLHLKTIIK